MIIWVMGLSGAGKTTIGSQLYQRIKETHKNTVWLDGDIFRGAMGNDLGFTVEERERNAHRQANLCKLLDSQGIHVVCCILSNQRDVRELNRKQFSEYFEIFIDVSMDTLIKRDPKGLYQKVLKGETKNVVGVDIEFFPPAKPDMVIDNNEFVDLDKTVNEILRKLPSLKCDQRPSVINNQQKDTEPFYEQQS